MMGQRKFWIYLSLLKMYQTPIKCTTYLLPWSILNSKGFGIPVYVYVRTQVLRGKSSVREREREGEISR